jgi:WD40 repeat protein
VGAAGEPIDVSFLAQGGLLTGVAGRAPRYPTDPEARAGAARPPWHRRGSAYPYVYDVSFSPDGARLATAGWDGTLRTWDVATGAPLRTTELPGFVHAAAWSPKGDAVAAAVAEVGEVHLVDPATGISRARATGLAVSSVGALAYAPDGSRVVATGGQAPVGLDGRPRTA